MKSVTKNLRKICKYHKMLLELIEEKLSRAERTLKIATYQRYKITF